MIATRLNKRLAGKQLEAISILGGRYATHGEPNLLAELNDELTSNTVRINTVNVKGKLLYWQLSGKYSILNTLGMSGCWKIKKADKHCDIEVTYGGGKKLWFQDLRHYGTLKVVLTNTIAKELSKKGPDVLSKEGVQEDFFFNLCDRYSHWTMPKLLMDQSKVSGIGNYLKG